MTCVAELNRGPRRGGRKDVWWAYCEDHLYGRWIENGAVYAWFTRKDSDTQPIGEGEGGEG